MVGPADFNDLLRGCSLYRQGEPREAAYRVATHIVSKSWGNVSHVVDGIATLLWAWIVWARFDRLGLERFVTKHHSLLDDLRTRDIEQFTPDDEPVIVRLLRELLAIDGIGLVSASKILHLLAPSYFTLWDENIVKAYGCQWRYEVFMQQIQEVSERLLGSYMENLGVKKDVARKNLVHLGRDSGGIAVRKSLVKLIDEYNYATYTLPKLRRR